MTRATAIPSSARDVQALADLPRDQAVRQAVAALDVEDRDVQTAALELIQSIDAIGEAIALGPRAILALAARSPHTRVRSALSALLQHADPGIRSDAALLVDPRDESNQRQLRVALSDDNADVRAAAAWALGAVADPALVAEVRRMLAAEPVPALRHRLADALERMGAL